MVRLLLAVLAFSIAGVANAKSFETQCGGKTFQVEVINGGDPRVNEYRLSVMDAEGEDVLFTTDEGWFHAKCVTANDGEEFLLFQSYCSGSVCVEDRYGIIEPGSLALLLTPGTENVGNSEEATSILGFEAPYLPEDTGAFCCE